MNSDEELSAARPSELALAFVWRAEAGARVNPNGIPAQNPGLRGTSYPEFLTGIGPTLLGLGELPVRFPRVASRTRLPWAERRNPFGIVAGGVHAWTRLLFPTLLLTALLSLPGSALAQGDTNAEAISREVSVFNLLVEPEIIQAISREVSVFNVQQEPLVVEAISREFSVLNFSATLQLVQLGRGTVTASPSNSTYLPGQSVTLTAAPRNPNWTRFVSWSDGDTNATRVITVGLSNVFTATFTNFVTLEHLAFKRWEANFGGTGDDGQGGYVLPTSDGGYVLAASSFSPPSGNKNSINFGGYDYWVIKLDASGSKQWDRSFGGDGDDILSAISQIADGGFIITGQSASGATGNKTNASFGGGDAWVVRLDAAGNKLWERAFGGTGDDKFHTIEQTEDGGFIFGGRSSSTTSGNKTSPNYGSVDLWIVRTDAAGNKLWEQSVGGTGADYAFCVRHIGAGEFVVCGRTGSGPEGNKASPFYGNSDAWLLKFDPFGNKVWESDFGGTGEDGAQTMWQTSNGGYMLAGYSNSGLTGNKMSTNQGDLDYWLIRTDVSGNKLSDHSFGGLSRDTIFSAFVEQGGGFFVGGSSASGVSGNKVSPTFGSGDYWVLRTDAFGNKLSEHSFGGAGDEALYSIEPTPDGGLILGGYSASGVSGNKGTSNYGSNDLWVLKLAQHEAPIGTPVFFVAGQFASDRTNIFNAQTPVSITLTSTWNGPIHFTTDGSEPDFTSAQYDPQNPPQVVPPATVKAIAYLDDLYLLNGLYLDYTEVVSTRLEYVPLYTMSVSTPGGGTVAVNPATASYASNAVVTISATNLPGWTFLGWQGDVTDTNPVVAVTMNSNVTAQAIFGTTLTTNATTAGNSIGRAPALSFYPYGSTVRLTALPAAARYLAFWTGALSGATSPQEIVFTNANPVVGAIFGTITGTNFGLTVQVTGEGSVSYTPATNRFGSNSVVTLTATPRPGWAFVNWTGGSNSAANPFALVMHTNKTVTANFSLLECAPVSSGLAGWWRGESNTLDSAGTNHGTPLLGVAYAPGISGQAYSLDGNGAHVDAGPAASLAVTDNLTVTFWARPASTSGNTAIVDMADPGAQTENYAVLCVNGALHFQYRLASGDITNASVPGFFANGVWVHGAVTFAGGTATLHKNGVLVAQATGLPLLFPDPDNVFKIGRYQVFSPSYFNGLIDEVSVHNRALGSNEIAAIFNAGSAGLCPPGAVANTPPSVALSNPIPNATFTTPASIVLQAGASDSDGTVASVQFRDGTNLIATSTSAPFGFTWTNAALGGHSLTAVATDNGGLSATSAPVNITVQTAVPEIVLNSPTNGNVFLAPVNVLISALVSDADNSVGFVSFYDGTNWLGSVTNPPYRLTWTNTPLGAHSFYSVAHDVFGPVVTSSPPAVVTVTSTATNPPVFSWSNAVVEVGEAGGAVTLHVFKSADSSQIPADIGFHPQSASADTADFTPPGFSQLSFAVGETVKPITIPIIQDSLVESNHFFFLVLDLISGSISGPADAQVTILDDDVPGTNSLFTRVAPNALPAPLATLRVDLAPTNVGQWRFVWENAWHDGGASVAGLPPGNYELQFKPVSGYIEPLATYVAVITNTLNSYSFIYSNTAAPQLGSLVVNINPAFVATNGNPNERGQWRRVGEALWHNSGETVDALPAGSHVIEFKLLTAGSWQTPSAQEVTVLPNQLNNALGEYFVANPTPGTGPTPLAFSSQVQNPFGFQRGYQFCGQLLTPLGWGSGTVVKQRVVLTAAHVVFDDYALAFVPNDAVKWFFQRQAGEYEPAPQTPRGFVVSSGYAAQRQAEATPGLSGTASRDLDLAALYFGEAAGRGGFSGYLVSKPGEEWLQIATSASLAGYPVEGIPAQDRGRMHRTVDQAVSWSVVSNQVYATTEIKSYPGNSGGPILVQLATNVNHWPAAVYLGGSGNTIVRAIDSLAVGLINTAEVLGNAGGNNTGGEPPRRATDCPTCSPLIYGVIEVSLNPTNIGALGGGYRFKNATNGVIYREPFNRFLVLGNVPWTLEFLPAPYTIAPTNRTLTTTAGHTNKTTGLYKQWGQLAFDGANLRALGSSGVVYRIDFKPALTTNAWTPVRTQTLTGAGLTLTNLVPGASNGFFRAVLVP